MPNMSGPFQSAKSRVFGIAKIAKSAKAAKLIGRRQRARPVFIVAVSPRRRVGALASPLKVASSISTRTITFFDPNFVLFQSAKSRVFDF